MKRQIDLVIFDCDGVLVDSERLANTVFAQILADECGLNFTLEQMFQIFVGKSSSQCMQLIESYMGEPPPSGLESIYEKAIQDALMSNIQEVSGIRSVLEDLEIPCCVASSGSHEKMDITLSKTNLRHFFKGNIFSASDIEHGKPSPDLYLHAAKKMGMVTPRNCLVIEDSPTGVLVGKNAGMLVFGYCELIDSKLQISNGADEVFDNMTYLSSLIQKYSG